MKPLFAPMDECIAKAQAQLLHLIELKRNDSPQLCPSEVPSAEHIAALVETAFWASLSSNEGRPTRFRAAIVGRQDARGALAFKQAVTFDERRVVKLSPALPSGNWFTLSTASGDLKIWGWDQNPHRSARDFVSVEVLHPGVVRIGVGPFDKFAICDGRSNHVIRMHGHQLAWHFYQVLEKRPPAEDDEATNAAFRECMALQDLVRLIVADGHGGALLVVPDASGDWAAALESCPYRLETPDSSVPAAIRKELRERRPRAQLTVHVSTSTLPDEEKVSQLAVINPPQGEGMARHVREIAALARVDGAVVLSREVSVLAFGAFVGASDAQEKLPDVCEFSAMPGQQEIRPTSIAQTLGTRHQSAARFVAHDHKAVAVVISHDRTVSVMDWFHGHNAVKVLRNAEWWL